MNALLLTAMLIGQCPGGVCPAPQPQAVTPLSWVTINTDNVGLYSGSTQIGVYSVSRDTYWNVDPVSRAYSQPTTPPIAPPKQEKARPSWETSGVDKSRVSQSKKYTRESGEVSEQRAFELIGDTIPNDANHLHVTFIDADVSRAKAALEDFRSKQPEVAKTVHTKAYQADDPTVRDAGFVTTGKPTVYIQQGQTVVGRSDSYPGANELAQAIRRKQPNYDPSKDPPIGGGNHIDLNALLSKLGAWLQTPLGIIIAVVLGLLVFARKSDSKA